MPEVAEATRRQSRRLQYRRETFTLDFSTLDNTDVLETFDFDSFLNTTTDDAANFDSGMMGGNFGVDAGNA